MTCDDGNACTQNDECDGAGNCVGRDLVIVDVLLPGLDGVTVLTRLRQHDPRLPLIAMSAGNSVPDLEGIPFLAKPFGLSTLLQLVEGTVAGSLPGPGFGTPPSSL